LIRRNGGENEGNEDEGCSPEKLLKTPRSGLQNDTLKVNVSVRGGPIVLELSNDGGWQQTTREMKVKSKSIESGRMYRLNSKEL
jgi:hypothetical protein